MEFIALLLFVFWLFTTALRFNMLASQGHFTYTQIFMGSARWYQSPRMIILIITLALLVYFGTLHVIYLAGAITAGLMLLLFGRNLLHHWGNQTIALINCVVCVLVLGGALVMLHRL